MKKIFCMAALLLSGACLLGGCDYLGGFGSSSDNSASSIEQSSSIAGTSDSSFDSSNDNKDSSSVSSSSSTSSDRTDKDSSSSSDSSSNSGNGDTTYKYTDFTAAEQALFEQYIGEVVPFIPNNEYYVEGYYEESDYEHGINFYTVGNTVAEFETYIDTAFTAYTKTETYLDDYDDLWHVFEKNDIVIEVAIYTGANNKTYVDLYVYSDLSTDIDWGDDSSWDWGDDSSWDWGDDSNDSSSADILTNADKDLPTGTDGVYNVDFTKAKYVKDVTDQGYYLDGCPTLSTTNKNPAVLVIPVEFSDVTAVSKGYTIDTLKKAFNGKTGETDYYSVYDYYFQSSYGKLKLDITVLDDWFRPTNASTYYKKQTMQYYGTSTEIGDQMVLNEALSYLDKTKNMDLSKFDSDGNGTIDAVILINTLTIDSDVTFNWAYRYWNIYTGSDGNYYEYDNVYANDYLWASYQFLFETNTNGETTFDKKDAINTYTFIHEFGHVLGADDYYDTAYLSSTTPLAGHDVMDGETGDHNAFTKFNYGWLTTSRLVVAEESVTLDLEAFSKNGDTILLANHWDDDLGAYQEYYIVVYYTNDGLNAGNAGYFDKAGILVYHVNASLYKEIEDGTTYYDVYNNNTNANDTDGYGTENNLIEFVSNGYLGEYLFQKGESLGSVVDDQGDKLAYTFTVTELTDSKATLTFTKTK